MVGGIEQAERILFRLDHPQFAMELFRLFRSDGRDRLPEIGPPHSRHPIADPAGHASRLTRLPQTPRAGQVEKYFS